MAFKLCAQTWVILHIFISYPWGKFYCKAEACGLKKKKQGVGKVKVKLHAGHTGWTATGVDLSTQEKNKPHQRAALFVNAEHAWATFF